MCDTLGLLQDLPAGATPPEIAHVVHRIARKRLGHADPYREAKDKSTQAALALCPRLKALVVDSPDPVDAAVRVSIVGNIMDLGVDDEVPDLWSTVGRVMAAPFAVDHLGTKRSALAVTDHVLYLADYAGETVFDRVLIEQLDAPVLYAVKGGPVLNDVTPEDAVAAGLDACWTIIDNGSDARGTVLERCSPAFHEKYRAAPLIIAKGQANYETLSDAGPGCSAPAGQVLGHRTGHRRARRERDRQAERCPVGHPHAMMLQEFAEPSAHAETLHKIVHHRVKSCIDLLAGGISVVPADDLSCSLLERDRR